MEKVFIGVRGGNIWNVVTKNFRDYSVHPLPCEDHLLNFSDLADLDYYFRFNSIEDYKTWVFNPYWRMQFRKYDIFLSIYEVSEEDVRKGNGQIMFKRDNAKLISREAPFFLSDITISFVLFYY